MYSWVGFNISYKWEETGKVAKTLIAAFPRWTLHSDGYSWFPISDR